ncbi:uncharacterized protein Dsimw501_GD29118 [Drosophila simulans]|nr:uncharacterized protein Dsimw501_GD29118 [Drosophila simulans]
MSENTKEKEKTSSSTVFPAFLCPFSDLQFL